MSMFEFKDPYYLLLLIPFILYFTGFYFFKLYKKKESSVSVSSIKIVKGKSTLRSVTYPYLNLLRIATILILIFAIARPGRGVKSTSVNNLGIDIMIALDISGSMMGEDFQPKNRLHVAKEVLKSFIKKRKGDKIGLVIFAGEAYLQCPPTIEKDMINEIVDELDFDSISEDGTAIGDAIALATSRLMESKAKSKIILLLTDGKNNRGAIDPEVAAKAAKSLGIKIYSVGIGKDGEVPYPADFGMFKLKRKVMNQFDEEAIKKLSEITGGKFYRATDSGILWDNIKDIDRLEKSEYSVKVYHQFFDRFDRYLFIAFFLFIIEILLRSLFYRKIP